MHEKYVQMTQSFSNILCYQNVYETFDFLLIHTTAKVLFCHKSVATSSCEVASQYRYTNRQTFSCKCKKSKKFFYNSYIFRFPYLFFKYKKEILFSKH